MFKKTGIRQGWTLASSFCFEGKALMSGTWSKICVKPRQEAGFAISSLGEKAIPVDEESVIDASQRMTQIRFGQKRIMLVEHLMSALKGMGFDSAEIEISGIEVPIFDGSALYFAKELRRIEKKPASMVEIYTLVEPIEYETGPSRYLLTPLKGKFAWECVIDYPDAPAIGLQRFHFDSETSSYFEDVASARSFCLEHEAEMMKAKGLIHGATLDNGVVFGKEGPLNSEGLRFENEPARHKLLDLIGDLAFLGVDLHFHGVALKPGHKSNNDLAKIIRKSLV